MDQDAGRKVGLIVFCSVLAFIGGGTTVYFTTRAHRPPAPVVFSTPLPTLTLPPSAAPAPLRVYVSGAVCSPAVYELPAGSIVRDALDAAGGPATGADLTRINLALELRDQQHVHVARQGEITLPPAVSGGAGTADDAVAPIDINTATAAELETLPGIGEVTAERIVAYRQAHGPFEAIEDIQQVSGVGPKTFDGIKDRITAGP